MPSPATKVVPNRMPPVFSQKMFSWAPGVSGSVPVRVTLVPTAPDVGEAVPVGSANAGIIVAIADTSRSVVIVAVNSFLLNCIFLFLS